MKLMRRVLVVAAVMVFLGGLVRVAQAAPEDRWVHVRVESKDGESVRVNVPLSMAEKILPTINHGDLHGGRIKFDCVDTQGIDLRALLDAVRTAPDNEFVTVQSKDSDVRVAKASGNLVVHVLDKGSKDKPEQRVEVIVPMKVIDALVSTDTKEFDIVAALHALRELGDVTLVTVKDGADQVRVWIDAHSESQ